jgi:multisubunit Na+/H+ antiporter MnhB subunit
MTAVVVLVIIAVLAIIAAIMYFTEPARSLPSVLGAISHPASRANAHRTTRAWIALAVGVICLVAAGLVSWMGRPSSR